MQIRPAALHDFAARVLLPCLGQTHTHRGYQTLHLVRIDPNNLSVTLFTINVTKGRSEEHTSELQSR